MESVQTHSRIDNDALFRLLRQRPEFAWPTLALLLIAFGLFASGVGLYLYSEMPLALAVSLNTLAAYLAFTVAHDASHNAVSTHRSLNDWVGRIATALLSPVPFFKMFRYIHMQHHRFANEENDPDLYCGRGPTWLLPFKWATLDLHYFVRYLEPSLFRSRPMKERREFIIACGWALLVMAALVISGFAVEYVLLFIVPTRIAVVLLAFAFDFLPHYPHTISASEAPYQATSNRVGSEWLLTPLLLSQNYHLVHHLYPTVPFYRYLRVWCAKKAFHLAQRPAQVSAFALSAKPEQSNSVSSA